MIFNRTTEICVKQPYPGLIIQEEDSFTLLRKVYFYAMLLFLIGMPGSGKTFWLKHFASALRYQTVDLDHFIEERQGRSIPELFQKGENHFRQIEQTALLTLIRTQQNTVIATGGGTACYGNNLEEMKQNGLTVYLQVSVHEVCHRLEQDVTARPLLDQLSFNERFARLTEMLSKREHYYQQSDIVFHTETDNFADIIKQIQSRQHQNSSNHV